MGFIGIAVVLAPHLGLLQISLERTPKNQGSTVSWALYQSVSQTSGAGVMGVQWYARESLAPGTKSAFWGFSVEVRSLTEQSPKQEHSVV